MAVLSCCSQENISGYYRVSVFFLAKVLIDFIPMRILPPFIYCAIAYFMVGKYNARTHVPYDDLDCCQNDLLRVRNPIPYAPLPPYG